jgi:hypothetical protein
MNRSLRGKVLHFLAVLLIVVAPPARAAKVEGTATDYADGSPLDGVRVFIMEGMNVKGGPNPTVNGRYEFNGVGVGSYTVRFDLTGYTPRPDDHDLAIQNATDAKRIDAELMREGAPTAYYAMAGDRFAKLVNQDNGTPAAYLRRWAQLRRIGPAPAAKIELIRSLATADRNAVKYLPLDQYLSLDPKDVERIAQPFNMALRFNEGMPNRGFADVGDEVIADVVLHELRKSNAEPNTKDQFVAAFDREWTGSKAAGIVTRSHQRDRMQQRANPR